MSEMKKGFQYADHRPVTRRQFLGLGMGQAASLMFLPDLLSLLGKRAFAGNCDLPLSEMHPFLLFDLIGGASLAGNFLVGKKGGPEDFLKSYDTMGVPKSPAAGEPIDNSFGVPMFTNLSQMRAGLVSTASPEALANLRMATICNSSQDDTGENELSPVILVSHSGLTGRHFKSGLALADSDSGGNSKGPVVDALYKPVSIRTAADVAQSLSYGEGLRSLGEKQKIALSKALARLSDGQLDKLRKMGAGEQFRAIASCGYSKNVEFAYPIQGVDPAQDPMAAQVFNGVAENASSAVIYNAINRNCGPGVIGIDGCDYHDGTQTTGDAKDLEIGQTVGRAVELAARLKKPLFFALVSDGATYSDQGTRIWRGDAGQKGLAVMGYYHPTKTPELRRAQIGNFTDGQGVNRESYVGAEPRRVAYTIFANYLSVNGKVGQFEQLAGVTGFDPSQVDLHLAFA